ncbi:conjugal transfer protein TraN [Cereibacter sp. SYSU M97828]|nr:conjugal transfer protein TraN [Cereibacter flavus]
MKLARALLIAVSAMTIGTALQAQEAFDPTARAKAAGNASRLGSGSSVFTQGGIDNALPIYEGTDTPETSINKGNIDARTKDALTGGTTAAGVYEDMIDSIDLRPQYDIPTDHIGITNADKAHTEAEDIAGQYFQSDVTENPACNFADFSVLEPFERYCDVHAQTATQGCKIDREVEIDRLDTWRCEVADTTVTVECDTDHNGECNVADLPDGNEASSCSPSGETCLEEEEVALREPWVGYYFEDENGQPIQGRPREMYWGSSGRDESMCYFWKGEHMGCSRKCCSPVDHEHHNGGWIYKAHGYCNGGFSSRVCGIIRFKKEGRDMMMNDPPAGGYLGAESGNFYGWSDGGRLWWNGANLGIQENEFVSFECIYKRVGQNGTHTAPNNHTGIFHGVQRSCVVPPRCLRKSQEYYCPDNDQCSGLRETAACTELGSRCMVTENGECSLERFNYSCLNDLTDHKPALLLESKIDRIEDKLVNRCDALAGDLNCVSGETTCVVGEEVRTIMGFPVSRECWQYEQSYQCIDGAAGNHSDCGPFEADASCEVISKTCLSYDEEEGEAPVECRHWEYGYRCGGGMQMPSECTAMNVCVGGLCEGIDHEANTDFANAAAWLTVLDEAAKDTEKSLDLQSVTMFSGTARNCKVGALGTINCCRDSGWANGVIGDCSESELALMDRVQAKAAVYLGTYCSRKVLGVCVQKRRGYCTFNSQLGMVFQKEIRRLSGTGFGSAKNPSCDGLPLDQIDTIDWDQIDLSEAFEDMMNDAAVPTSDMVTDYLKDRLELTAGEISEGE